MNTLYLYLLAKSLKRVKLGVRFTLAQWLGLQVQYMINIVFILIQLWILEETFVVSQQYILTSLMIH